VVGATSVGLERNHRDQCDEGGDTDRAAFMASKWLSLSGGDRLTREALPDDRENRKGVVVGRKMT